ncbi:hypothetical protein CB0940_09579 [Cercospora beticola]|uniref:RAD50-interacting protein 1 n=1 Tax=Cercospora beticola TaxID=122368 RepID=A0A2G5HGG0_CERBT|nr:hypothetical protein CB0940_09579 [Cercospora beticola]PIA91630.1 hypothetical protein CB0940_09579 [Cercospora beticola]WPB06090.1 hypothetical protein RHO25_010747 [Cercospora beticola]
MDADTRVQDYLDDKLQSAADLDSLDALLATVQEQQDLLKRQLEDAKRDHDEATRTYESHKSSLHASVQTFQQEQSDIDLRLQIITQSDTSDDAVVTFEATMAKLRKLDMAAGYVELLNEVDRLKGECLAQLGKDDDAALAPYKQLQQLAAGLEALHDATEGAAPHLIDHIQRAVKDLRGTVRTAIAANLEKTLQKMNWPKTKGHVPLALEQEWQTIIGRLLDLQKPELEAREQKQQKDDPPPLLPFEVLVHPLEQRFDYHFSGNRPTNRLDKPEIFLNHVLELIAECSSFVQDNLQPLLLKHFGRTDLAFTPAYIDAISALITALLPMLQDKLENVARQSTSQPGLFSNLVQEVIRFDNVIKDDYSYSPSSPALIWRGLSYFLLETCNYFDQWLSFERDFALTRYQNIIDSSDAGELDHDAVSAGATTPSKAAVRLNDLLETITGRYRYLSSYSQRVRFLIDIQIHIFDTYHGRLQQALDAYSSMTSTLGRTMANVSKEQLADLQGVKGLDRLCRIFGSADYLERAMRDWSDDLFFLELWDEMNNRHKSTETANNRIGSWSELQQKTSSALGAENEGGLEGALFDETASSYHRLRARSENVLIETLKYDVQQALKPYSAVNTWASLSSSTSSASSAELDPALNLLTEYFAFLRKALGKAPLRRIGRQVCHAIETYIWGYVLQGKSAFSTAGATQLTTDLGALCNVIDRYMGTGQAQIGLRRLLEGVTLLSLPVRGEIPRVQIASPEGNIDDADDDETAAWGDDDNADGVDGTPSSPRDAADGSKSMSLFQAERLVFMNNESARLVLEQLGLDTLSEQDARAILRQRVEISS